MKFNYLLLLLLAAPSPSAKAGGSFSGGEDAIACFSSKEIAAVAMESRGRIKPEFKNKITKLYAAEFWEGAARENSANLKMKFLKPLADDTNEKFIDRALRIRFINQNRHLFYNLVRQTQVELVPFEKWAPSDQVMPIEDHGINVETEPKCKIVQIARWDKLPSGKFQVTFDQALYQHPSFDPLNKAMVQMHEIIYVLAGKLGHDRSERVRSFVRFLFKDIPFNPVVGPDEYISGELLVNGLAIYPQLLELIPAKDQNTDDLARRRSYLQLIDAINDWAKLQGKTVEQIVSDTGIVLRFFKYLEDRDQLTDEIAFLWEVGHSGRYFDHLIDGQNLKVPNDEEKPADPVGESCFDPYYHYTGLFGIVVHAVTVKKQWSLPASTVEKLHALAFADEIIVTRSNCDLLKELQPFDETAQRYVDLCRLRERAQRYCNSLGKGWKAKN